MARPKLESPTGTIAFRWPQTMIDKIRATAKERNMTIQEFFLSQIATNSDLMSFIMEDKQNLFVKAMHDNQARMAEDVKKMVETSGLSEDQVIEQITMAMKMMVKGQVPPQ